MSLSGLINTLTFELHETQEKVKRLEKILVEAVIPLETLGTQIEKSHYTELSLSLQDQILVSRNTIRDWFDQKKG